MKIKSLVSLAIFVLLLGFASLARAQIPIMPVPPLIGPADEAQVRATMNVLLGNPGTYSNVVDLWMTWIMSGNPWAPAPATNLVPDAEHIWAYLQTFPPCVGYPPGYGPNGAIFHDPDFDDDDDGPDAGDLNSQFDWSQFAPFLQQQEY